MVARLTLITAGESLMNWELTYQDKILRLKSGAGYALGMCIVLDADYLALSFHTNEVVKLKFHKYQVMHRAEDNWTGTARTLMQRYREMIS